MNRFCLTLFLAFIAVHGAGCVTESAQKEAEKRKIDKQKAPKTEEQLLDEARVHFAIGKYETAEQLMDQVLEKNASDARYHMLQADIRFMQANVDGALESYDEVIRLEPDTKPRLWQRGLALYYAGNFDDGKAQFETHQTVNSADVENAVWHMLCNAKVNGLENARAEMIPIEGDTRIPMAQIYEVFAGRMEPAQTVATSADSKDIQSSLYYAFLYNGLYYEMIGEPEKSLASIEKATKAKSSAAKDQLMNQLATIHLRLRSGKNNADND